MWRPLTPIVACLAALSSLVGAFDLNGADVYIHSGDHNSALRAAPDGKYWVPNASGAGWRGEESFHVEGGSAGASLQSNIHFGYPAVADSSVPAINQPIINSSLPYLWTFEQVQPNVPIFKIKKANEELYWTALPTVLNKTHDMLILSPPSHTFTQTWSLHRVVQNSSDFKDLLDLVNNQPAVKEAMNKKPKQVIGGKPT